MSTIDALREGIRALLEGHPAVRELADPSLKAPHTKKIERYSCGADRGIGHEIGPAGQQNVWVPLGAIRLESLTDIPHVMKPGYGPDEKPGRNSNLEQIPGFRRAPVVCFMPRTVREAERIISAVAGPAT